MLWPCAFLCLAVLTVHELQLQYHNQQSFALREMASKLISKLPIVHIDDQHQPTMHCTLKVPAGPHVRSCRVTKDKSN